MEEWLLYKEFRFEAAHRLPSHDGKCRRLHGHSWVSRIYVTGNKLVPAGPKKGMLLDFDEVKKYFLPIVDEYLDHHYLNDTTGLENPTSEELARWIYEKLEKTTIPGLYAVEVCETCTCGVRYRK